MGHRDENRPEGETVPAADSVAEVAGRYLAEERADEERPGGEADSGEVESLCERVDREDGIDEPFRGQTAIDVEPTNQFVQR